MFFRSGRSRGVRQASFVFPTRSLVTAARLTPIRERRAALKRDPCYVFDLLRAGTMAAREKTQATLDDIRSGLGLSAFEQAGIGSYCSV
jgi:hypothetical protein